MSVHQVVVVGVGLVELEHGELGIVLGADAFVAEVAIDLVDAVHAADHQALEVELGRDAEEEVGRSSALWCVVKGRAAAPPATVCIIGVSTSR